MKTSIITNTLKRKIRNMIIDELVKENYLMFVICEDIALEIIMGSTEKQPKTKQEIEDYNDCLDLVSNIIQEMEYDEFIETKTGKIKTLKKFEKIKKSKINENTFIDKVEFSNTVLQLLLDKKKDDATEIMVNRLLQTNYIYTTRNDEKSEMWIYKDGIYIPQAKTYIKEFCRDVLGVAYNEVLANKVLNKIEVDTYIEQEKFFIIDNIYKIPVINGIIDLKINELISFNPKFRFFNKIPIYFDKNKKCPTIKQFLNDILPSEHDVNIIQELFGYLLLRDYKFEKAFMFIGDGRNGKGKLIELMKKFLGEENCTNIPLQALENDGFAVGELHNKMANLCGDLSKESLKRTGYFKNLTGHDMITVARKFLSRISFLNYAKLIFACNELPKSYDETFAFFNRWVILDFKFTFIDESEYIKLETKENYKIADKEIINKITTNDELSGLLNWALQGLKRLLKNNEFSFSSSTKEVKNMWLRKSDSVNAFIMDYIELNFDNDIEKLEFRKKYTEYCKKYKLKIQSDRAIKQTLETSIGISDKRTMIDGAQKNVWSGIIFTDDKNKKNTEQQTLILCNVCKTHTNITIKPDGKNFPICMDCLIKFLSDKYKNKMIGIGDLSYIPDKILERLEHNGVIFKPNPQSYKIS